MRKTQRDKKTDYKASLQGMLVVVLALVCFLALMELVVVAVRFFAG